MMFGYNPYNSYNYRKNYYSFPYVPSMPHINPKQNIHVVEKNKQDYKPKNIPEIKECKSDDVNYDQYFEIFGLKLYFDDLLILILLFFLYKEDVKDNYLYIVLFLLLLS